MSVLLVEDSAPVRQRLCALITETESLQVAAEAATVAEATTLFDSVHPEAVLLDLALPDGSGLDVLRHVRTAGAKCLVLILSNHAEPETRRGCCALGADYVFRKADEFEQALETLRSLSVRAENTTKRPRPARRVHRARLVVTCPIGLHIRPAALLAKQAQAFDAEIELSLNGKKANAKSILSVMILCAEHGAEVRLSASGNDAEEAVRAITALFASNFEEPLRPDVSEKMTESPRSAQPSGGVGEMVLVADDEQCIRDLIGKVLERNGYRPLLARNGLEAVSLYTANASNIKVAVFDMIMPEMNGFEAISAIRRMNPNLPVLSMSGSMEKPPLPIDATTAFLRKPFSLAEFLPALRTLLDGAPSARAVGAHSR
jgi:phosphotransferase system HPr (HPr) family protein